MNVAVLGAGLMGSQIAAEYALAGHRVVCVVRRDAPARERVERALALVVELGVHPPQAVAAARGRMSFATDVAALAGADLVVECLPEELAVKADALRIAARLAPDAPLATNTSSLRIGAIAEAVGAGERILGTHYWNPPLLMPLVEVVPGERTAHAAVELMTATLRAIGKRPLLVRRDVPGFLWNRLQVALLREAVWLVEHGVASAEDVDAAVRLGLGRRWSWCGPFETVALGGVETWTRVAAQITPSLSTAGGIDGLARWAPDDPGQLDEMRRRRDAALAALLAGDEHDRHTRNAKESDGT